MTTSTTLPDRPARQRPSWLPWASALLTVLILAGCTNSKLLVAPFYNRLDDQMRKEFVQLADWNDEQLAAFEQSIGTFHVWHRQSELPEYADLLAAISSSIRTRGATNAEDITLWATTAEEFTQGFRQCHPINFLFPMMKTMTDEQIDGVRERWEEKRQKNRQRYFSRTPEERLERRASNVVKWAGRIGVTMTDRQIADLRKSLGKQVSLRKEYYALSDQWNDDFFAIAKAQDATDYDDRMQSHLDKLWQLLETNHKEEWQQNRELWRDHALRFVQSMTENQRVSSSVWLAKMGRTLEQISADPPSFNIGDDPTVGCLPDGKT